MFFCSRCLIGWVHALKLESCCAAYFSALVLWLRGVSLHSLEYFYAFSSFSCGGQCSGAALQKACVGHPNEGSLPYFLALLFFPGVGAGVMVGLLGRRLSVILLLCWNVSSLVCRRITFLSEQGEGGSCHCCCPAAEMSLCFYKTKCK